MSSDITPWSGLHENCEETEALDFFFFFFGDIFELFFNFEEGQNQF